MGKRLHQKTKQFYNPPFSHPAAKSDKTPPLNPYSDWKLKVPFKGKARSSIPIHFKGTVNHEKKDPFASFKDREKRKKFLKKRALKNQTVLNKAIFILSQSATGRALLKDMTHEGYSIVFDNRRTKERGASGLCDPNSKMLILHAHDNPEYLALLIGHEGIHALQNARHDIFPSTLHTPETGIKLSFAIEADAYAQQTQIALELFYGDPSGPKDQIRFKGPLKQMRDRFPELVKATEKVLHTEEALENGAVVTAAFHAFYNNFYLRTFYEDAHTEWANMYAPKMKSQSAWGQESFSKTIDSDYLKECLQHKGIPYLKKHAPGLNFNDARYSGLTQETVETIKKFYNNFLPNKPKPALKVFGIHMKDAIFHVFGLGTNIHMVIKKNQQPKYPPFKPPPNHIPPYI